MSAYYKNRLRLISILTLLCFGVQDIAWAAPGASSQPAAVSMAAPAQMPINPFAANPSQLSVPLDAVTLQEVHVGTNGKLIIHIQDAHANLSGQQSLAKALDHLLTQYDIKVVLVEGSARNSSLDQIRRLAPLKEWKIIARRFLYEGIISGEEYLNLTTEHPMKILGVEYRDLYDESVKAYAALVDRRKDILHYLYKSKVSLERLKARFYPQEIKDYEAAKGDEGNSMDGGSGNGIDFKSGVARLFKLAETAGYPLGGMKQAAKLKTLLDREQSIDFDRANAEQSEILRTLSARGAGEEVKTFVETSKRLQTSQVSQYRLLRQLMSSAESKRIALEAFPEIKAYEAYLSEFLDLKLDDLLAELELLEDKVYEKLLSTSDARKVRAIDRFLGLLGNAYKLQMSSQDFGMFTFNEKDFPTESWLAFMNRKLAELGFFESMVPYETYLDSARKDFGKFYELVAERDQAFVENARRIMDEEKTDAAVLIAGGYHTAHLTQLLRAEGTSYIVLTPSVTDTTDHDRYEKILLSNLRAQERHLAKTAANKDTGAYGGQNVAQTRIPRGLRALDLISGNRLTTLSTEQKKFTDAHGLDSKQLGETSSRLAAENPERMRTRTGTRIRSIAESPYSLSGSRMADGSDRMNARRKFLKQALAAALTPIGSPDVSQKPSPAAAADALSTGPKSDDQMIQQGLEGLTNIQSLMVGEKPNTFVVTEMPIEEYLSGNPEHAKHASAIAKKMNEIAAEEARTRIAKHRQESKDMTPDDVLEIARNVRSELKPYVEAVPDLLTEGIVGKNAGSAQELDRSIEEIVKEPVGELRGQISAKQRKRVEKIKSDRGWGNVLKNVNEDRERLLAERRGAEKFIAALKSRMSEYYEDSIGGAYAFLQQTELAQTEERLESIEEELARADASIFQIGKIIAGSRLATEAPSRADQNVSADKDNRALVILVRILGFDLGNVPMEKLENLYDDVKVLQFRIQNRKAGRVAIKPLESTDPILLDRMDDEPLINELANLVGDVIRRRNLKPDKPKPQQPVRQVPAGTVQKTTIKKGQSKDFAKGTLRIVIQSEEVGDREANNHFRVLSVESDGPNFSVRFGSETVRGKEGDIISVGRAPMTDGRLSGNAIWIGESWISRKQMTVSMEGGLIRISHTGESSQNEIVVLGSRPKAAPSSREPRFAGTIEVTGDKELRIRMPYLQLQPFEKIRLVLPVKGAPKVSNEYFGKGPREVIVKIANDPAVDGKYLALEREAASLQSIADPLARMRKVFVMVSNALGGMDPVDIRRLKSQHPDFAALRPVKASNHEILEKVGDLVKSRKNERVGIGFFINEEAGVCRHRAFLFEKLATAAGLTVALKTGKVPGGRHAWSEVTVGDKTFFVDVFNEPDIVEDIMTEEQRRYFMADSIDASVRSIGFKSDEYFEWRLLQAGLQNLIVEISPENQVRGVPAGQFLSFRINFEKDALKAAGYDYVLEPGMYDINRSGHLKKRKSDTPIAPPAPAPAPAPALPVLFEGQQYEGDEVSFVLAKQKVKGLGIDRKVILKIKKGVDGKQRLSVVYNDSGTERAILDRSVKRFQDDKLLLNEGLLLEDGRSYEIGRASDKDWVIPGSKSLENVPGNPLGGVSRHHVTVKVEGGQILVQNLSKNGTTYLPPASGARMTDGIKRSGLSAKILKSIRTGSIFEDLGLRIYDDFIEKEAAGLKAVLSGAKPALWVSSSEAQVDVRFRESPIEWMKTVARSFFEKPWLSPSVMPDDSLGELGLLRKTFGVEFIRLNDSGEMLILGLAPAIRSLTSAREFLSRNLDGAQNRSKIMNFVDSVAAEDLNDPARVELLRSKLNALLIDALGGSTEDIRTFMGVLLGYPTRDVRAFSRHVYGNSFWGKWFGRGKSESFLTEDQKAEALSDAGVDGEYLDIFNFAATDAKSYAETVARWVEGADELDRALVSALSKTPQDQNTDGLKEPYFRSPGFLSMEELDRLSESAISLTRTDSGENKIMRILGKGGYARVFVPLDAQGNESEEFVAVIMDPKQHWSAVDAQKETQLLPVRGLTPHDKAQMDERRDQMLVNQAKLLRAINPDGQIEGLPQVLALHMGKLLVNGEYIQRPVMYLKRFPVEGRELSHKDELPELTSEDKIRIALSLTKTLEYLSTRKEFGRPLIHRDIKPSNLWIYRENIDGKKGEYKAILYDFAHTLESNFIIATKGFSPIPPEYLMTGYPDAPAVDDESVLTDSPALDQFGFAMILDDLFGVGIAKLLEKNVDDYRDVYALLREQINELNDIPRPDFFPFHLRNYNLDDMLDYLEEHRAEIPEIDAAFPTTKKVYTDYKRYRQILQSQIDVRIQEILKDPSLKPIADLMRQSLRLEIAEITAPGWDEVGNILEDMLQNKLAEIKAEERARTIATEADTVEQPRSEKPSGGAPEGARFAGRENKPADQMSRRALNEDEKKVLRKHIFDLLDQNPSDAAKGQLDIAFDMVENNQMIIAGETYGPAADITAMRGLLTENPETGNLYLVDLTAAFKNGVPAFVREAVGKADLSAKFQIILETEAAAAQREKIEALSRATTATYSDLGVGSNRFAYRVIVDDPSDDEPESYFYAKVDIAPQGKSEKSAKSVSIEEAANHRWLEKYTPIVKDGLVSAIYGNVLVGRRTVQFGQVINGPDLEQHWHVLRKKLENNQFSNVDKARVRGLAYASGRAIGEFYQKSGGLFIMDMKPANVVPVFDRAVPRLVVIDYEKLFSDELTIDPIRSGEQDKSLVSGMETKSKHVIHSEFMSLPRYFVVEPFQKSGLDLITAGISSEEVGNLFLAGFMSPWSDQPAEMAKALDGVGIALSPGQSESIRQIWTSFETGAYALPGYQAGESGGDWFVQGLESMGYPGGISGARFAERQMNRREFLGTAAQSLAALAFISLIPDDASAAERERFWTPLQDKLKKLAKNNGFIAALGQRGKEFGRKIDDLALKFKIDKKSVSASAKFINALQASGKFVGDVAELTGQTRAKIDENSIAVTAAMDTWSSMAENLYGGEGLEEWAIREAAGGLYRRDGTWWSVQKNKFNNVLRKIFRAPASLGKLVGLSDEEAAQVFNLLATLAGQGYFSVSGMARMGIMIAIIAVSGGQAALILAIVNVLLREEILGQFIDKPFERVADRINERLNLNQPEKTAGRNNGEVLNKYELTLETVSQIIAIIYPNADPLIRMSHAGEVAEYLSLMDATVTTDLALSALRLLNEKGFFQKVSLPELAGAMRDEVRGKLTEFFEFRKDPVAGVDRLVKLAEQTNNVFKRVVANVPDGSRLAGGQDQIVRLFDEFDSRGFRMTKYGPVVLNEISYMPELRQRILRSLNDRLGPVKNGVTHSILSVGAGRGDLEEEILNSRPDVTITLVDINPKNVDFINRRLSAYKDRFSALVGDANELSNDLSQQKIPAQFEAVLMIDVIGYFSDLSSVFAQVAGAMAPKSRIFITSVAPEDMTEQSIEVTGSRPHEDPALLDSLIQNKFQLSDAGLERIEAEYSFDYQTNPQTPARRASVKGTTLYLEADFEPKEKAAVEDGSRLAETGKGIREAFGLNPGGIRSSLTKVYAEFAPTDRAGQEGRDTFRIFEIYDVNIGKEAESTLLARMENPDFGLFLVAEDDIRNWKTSKTKITVTDDAGNQKEVEASIANNAFPLIDGEESSPQSVLSKITTPTVRISSAGLARIAILKDGKAHYVLALNKDARSTGKYKLAPLGGATGNLSPDGLAALESLNVQTDDFEGVQKAVKKAQDKAAKEGRALSEEELANVKLLAERDLRFSLQTDRLNDYVRWFNSRQGRETDASRELGEELVDEQKIMDWSEWTWLSGEFPFSRMREEELLVSGIEEALRNAGAEDVSFVREAYAFARANHEKAENWMRDDGRVYIWHPLESAYYLAVGLGVTDKATLLASLFHDLIEDTPANEAVIRDFLNDKATPAEIDQIILLIGDLTENTVYRTQDGEFQEPIALVTMNFTAEEKRQIKGRLATKIEHLHRVAASSNASSALLKVVDRLHNLLTNEASPVKRSMDPLEIKAWMNFLDLKKQAIPESLRSQISRALTYESERIARQTAGTRLTKVDQNTITEDDILQILAEKPGEKPKVIEVDPAKLREAYQSYAISARSALNLLSQNIPSQDPKLAAVLGKIESALLRPSYLVQTTVSPEELQALEYVLNIFNLAVGTDWSYQAVGGKTYLYLDGYLRDSLGAKSAVRAEVAALIAARLDSNDGSITDLLDKPVPGSETAPESTDPAQTSSRAPSRVRNIAIPTAGRPESLKKLIASLVQTAEAYRYQDVVVTVFDTTDTSTEKGKAQAEENRKILEENRGRGLKFTYLNREEIQKNVWDPMLAALDGQSKEAARSLSQLTDIGWVRNSMIFYFGNQPVIHLDDDVLAEMAYPAFGDYGRYKAEAEGSLKVDPNIAVPIQEYRPSVILSQEDFSSRTIRIPVDMIGIADRNIDSSSAERPNRMVSGGPYVAGEAQTSRRRLMFNLTGGTANVWDAFDNFNKSGDLQQYYAGDAGQLAVLSAPIADFMVGDLTNGTAYVDSESLRIPFILLPAYQDSGRYFLWSMVEPNNLQIHAGAFIHDRSPNGRGDPIDRFFRTTASSMLIQEFISPFFPNQRTNRIMGRESSERMKALGAEMLEQSKAPALNEKTMEYYFNKYSTFRKKLGQAAKKDAALEQTLSNSASYREVVSPADFKKAVMGLLQSYLERNGLLLSHWDDLAQTAQSKVDQKADASSPDLASGSEKMGARFAGIESLEEDIRSLEDRVRSVGIADLPTLGFHGQADRQNNAYFYFVFKDRAETFLKGMNMTPEEFFERLQGTIISTANYSEFSWSAGVMPKIHILTETSGFRIVKTNDKDPIGQLSAVDLKQMKMNQYRYFFGEGSVSPEEVPSEAIQEITLSDQDLQEIQEMGKAIKAANPSTVLTEDILKTNLSYRILYKKALAAILTAPTDKTKSQGIRLPSDAGARLTDEVQVPSTQEHRLLVEGENLPVALIEIGEEAEEFLSQAVRAARLRAGSRLSIAESAETFSAGIVVDGAHVRDVLTGKVIRFSVSEEEPAVIVGTQRETGSVYERAKAEVIGALGKALLRFAQGMPTIFGEAAAVNNLIFDVGQLSLDLAGHREMIEKLSQWQGIGRIMVIDSKGILKDLKDQEEAKAWSGWIVTAEQLEQEVAKVQSAGASLPQMFSVIGSPDFIVGTLDGIGVDFHSHFVQVPMQDPSAQSPYAPVLNASSIAWLAGLVKFNALQSSKTPDQVVADMKTVSGKLRTFIVRGGENLKSLLYSYQESGAESRELYVGSLGKLALAPFQKLNAALNAAMQMLRIVSVAA